MKIKCIENCRVDIKRFEIVSFEEYQELCELGLLGQSRLSRDEDASWTAEHSKAPVWAWGDRGFTLAKTRVCVKEHGPPRVPGSCVNTQRRRCTFLKQCAPQLSPRGPAVSDEARFLVGPAGGSSSVSPSLHCHELRGRSVCASVESCVN